MQEVYINGSSDWNAISAALGRTVADCQLRWDFIAASRRDVASIATTELDTARSDLKDSSLRSLFNHVSANLSELRLESEHSWAELDTFTFDIFAHISGDSSENLSALLKILEAHGFVPDVGWNVDTVNIDTLLQALGSHSLVELADSDNKVDDEVPIKNYQALSFCPNVLFSKFPDSFPSQPCSCSFEAAVLLADISGFSKFAGEMTLKGAKGLDTLHKVTSDFLGHFVHTVYDYDGDGRCC